MDNQQLSSSFDKGWLAGIMDGEGCLQLAKQKYRNRLHYRPQLVIGNTNPTIIQNVLRIAKQNDLPMYVMVREKPAFRSKRKAWIIQIIGLQRVSKWMDYLGDSLVGKKKQADIMQEFIAYRLAQPPPSNGHTSITSKDHEFKDRMTNANRQYKGELLNDYTPDASNKDTKV